MFREKRGHTALEMNMIALEMNNYNANCNQQTKSNFFPKSGV